MEVYITNYKSSLIMEAAYNEEIEGEIFEDIKINFLSSLEKQSLLKSNEFYKSLSNELGTIEMFQRINSVDTRTMVHEGNPPAFHKDKNCDLLKSNMVNTFIPESIEDSQIDAFRKWFIKMEMKVKEGEISQAAFQARLGLKWKIYSLIDLDLQNSGVVSIANTTIGSIRNHVIEKVNAADNFRKNLNLEGQEILRNFATKSFIYKKDISKIGTFKYMNDFKEVINVDPQKIKDLLEEFELNYKQPLIEALKKYYKIKWGVKDTFDKTLLEAIGFKPCNKCCSDEKVKSFRKFNDMYRNIA